MMLRKKLKSLFTKIILDRYTGLRLSYAKWKNERSMGKLFTNVYRKGLWGGKPGELYSGGGSHKDALYMPYVNKIIEFLKCYGPIKPRVVDLGCGDFNVGKHLVPYCGEYIGADIVEDLIKKHSAAEYEDHIKFCILDIIKDELPDGDIALIRQVLQHLSNEQILKILPKLKKYKVIFITEHYPCEDSNAVPNKNIAPGAGFRFSINSGVYLDKTPFNIPIDSLELILEVPGRLGGGDGYIRTYKLSW